MTKTHGMSHKPMHRAWQRMIQRCDDKNCTDYKKYGARGIKVCARWRDFEKFYEDMGERPFGLTLERINNMKGYSKKNCKWATRLAQSQNRRTTYIVSFNGRKQSINAWAKEIGIQPVNMKLRLTKWSKKRALTEPRSLSHVKSGAASAKSQGRLAFLHRSRKLWGSKSGKRNYAAHKKRW